jgi:4-carboxymuconolactone decarboxylase
LNDTTAPGRVAHPDPAKMSDRQQALYDQMLAGPYGPLGPRMLLIHDPDLYDAWVQMSDTLLKNDIQERNRKLAILVIARHWTAQLEWWVHSREAIKAGIDPEVIAAIRENRTPDLLKADERAIYNFARELCCDRTVSDKTYAAARNILGDTALVQFTVFMGQYTNVAMMLVAHQLGLPEGVENPL